MANNLMISNLEDKLLQGEKAVCVVKYCKWLLTPSQVPQNIRVPLLVLMSQRVPQLLLRSFKVFLLFSD